MNILFVCHGNVNRSAAAEVIGRKDYPYHQFKSCGLKTTDGKIMAKKMRETLQEHGYDEVTRSSIITQEMVDWADVIFYMDNANERRFIHQFGNMTKAMKLSCYIPGVDRVPDPAYAKGHDTHHVVVNLIKNALGNLWISEKM